MTFSSWLPVPKSCSLIALCLSLFINEMRGTELHPGAKISNIYNNRDTVRGSTEITDRKLLL